jgi:hypothetical protein
MDPIAPEVDPEDGAYRLARFDVEVKGRWREFVKSVLLFLLLILMEYPLRSESLNGRTPRIAPVVSLRISLIIDVALIISYVLVAYRAWGLVRAFHAPPRIAIIARMIAYVVIPVLVLVDAAEDIYLWHRYSGADHVTSLSVWGSHQILVYGVPVALGINVILVLITDPRLYWVWRSGDTIPRQFKGVRPPVERLGSAADIERWKGALAPHLDDGSCRCGAEPIPAPQDPLDRDWGVICCSGGGVRSAAFSLGGLQSLNANNLYQKAGAVVGVSGGGYTSTAFHVTRWQSGNTLAENVDHDQIWTSRIESTFTPASPELQWLRRHTHYVLDSVRVAIQAALTLAFGIAVNLVLLAVAIGATAWFLAWLYLASGTIVLPDPQASSIQFNPGGDWWVLQRVWWLPLAGVGLFLVQLAWDRFHAVPHTWRTRLADASTWLTNGGVVLLLLLIGLPAAIAFLFDYADSSGSDYAKLIYSLGVVPQQHCKDVLAAGAEAACGVKKTAQAQTQGIGAASIVTIVTSILAVLASVKAASKSTSDASGVGGFFQTIWARIKHPVVPWLAVALIVLVCVMQLLRWTATLTTQPDRLDNWTYAGYAAIVLLLLKLLTEPNRTSLHHFFRERIAYAFLVRRRFGKVESLPYSEALRFSRSRPPAAKGPRLVTCAVANASDPTLVPSQRGCTPFVFDDEAIGLTDRLLPQEAARRGSATYEFAADHGYRDATIPAAVAMSAAAFSPLAGRENVRLGPYRAVLALGNARLGVWLPNPLWIDASKLAQRQARLRDRDFAKTWSRLSCQDANEVWGAMAGPAKSWARQVCTRAAPQVRLRHTGLWGNTVAADSKGPWWARPLEVGRTIMKKPGMTRVVREAVGRASIYDRFLYVTDGGHYDNLGLIEALRRKPWRVFVIDASNDAENTFRALGLAVATARMDLDCELRLDPRPMQRLEDKRSAAGWCTGKAIFADGTECAIFLVKAIMLDDMPWDVETYAASNLDFPRTSTGKQLYSEFDFEAYRVLGVRVVNELLGSKPYSVLERDTASMEAVAWHATAVKRLEQARSALAALDSTAEARLEVEAQVQVASETVAKAVRWKDEARQAAIEARASANLA